ncbi:sirohydrochlorin chelatase [Paenibacillus sp. CAU 1782]
MKKYGILVISHGSQETRWVKLVDEAVKTASAGFTVPVVSAFLEIVDGRLIQDGINELERLGVTDMLVVPLFVSSGSTHVDEIGGAFGLPQLSEQENELGTFVVSANVFFGAPIDDDTEIAELLLSNIAELSQEPAREALLLVGHGSIEPGFHERWTQGLQAMATRLSELGGFARVSYAMLLPDQAMSRLLELQEKNPGEDVIVVPLFLSQGYFTDKVIPKRLAGADYRYNGKAMLPNPAIERWLERQFREWLAPRV